MSSKTISQVPLQTLKAFIYIYIYLSPSLSLSLSLSLPLVSLGVVAAFFSSTMLLEIGLSFGVRLPADAANVQAGLSRSFLLPALVTSCSLQCWHAFGITMAGRTMPLLGATLTAAVSTLGLQDQTQTNRK